MLFPEEGGRDPFVFQIISEPVHIVDRALDEDHTANAPR